MAQHIGFASHQIARHRCVPGGASIKDALAATAVQAYLTVSRKLTDHTAAGYAPNQRAAALNNELFHLQAVHFRKHRAHLPILAALPEWCTLVTHFRNSCVEYMRRVHGVALPTDLSHREFAWCSVHSRGSGHPCHTHDDSILSGVFYAAVPTGAAPLVFHCGEEKMVHSAAEGEMVVFPSSLVHEVPTINAADSNQSNSDNGDQFEACVASSTEDLRVSFSYNLMRRSFR